MKKLGKQGKVDKLQVHVTPSTILEDVELNGFDINAQQTITPKSLHSLCFWRFQHGLNPMNTCVCDTFLG